jgi:hypothetical protein
MPEREEGSRIMATSPVENADNIFGGEVAFLTRPTHDDVARRAYDLYCSRGATDGHDIADWLEAERQLATDDSRPARARSAVTTPRARQKERATASR